jgi:hypothetical protein
MVLLTSAAVGHAEPEPWALRLEAGVTDYSRRTLSSHSSGYSELSLDGDNGFSLAAEYRHSSRVGLELSFSSVNLDAQWRQVEIRPVSFNPTVLREFTVASADGTFSLRPLAVTLLLHPLRSGRFDFYVGPQLAWVDFDIGLEGPPRREDEWAFGGKAGLEVDLGSSPWSAGLTYRYFETQHQGTERDQYTGIGIHWVSGVLGYKLGRGSA